MSTITLSKFIKVFALYYAIFYFLAIKIIRKIYKKAHKTRRISSLVSPSAFKAPPLKMRVNMKVRVQNKTTIASKIFHHLKWPVWEFVKKFSFPVSFSRKVKSIPIIKFKIVSITTKRGLLVTLKPSKIVTKIKKNDINRSDK